MDALRKLLLGCAVVAVFVSASGDHKQSGALPTVSITQFVCKGVWNPLIVPGEHQLLKDICNFRLWVTSRSEKPLIGREISGSVQILLATTSDIIKSTSLNEKDYWLLGKRNLTLKANGTTDVDVNGIALRIPHLCGQAFLIARVRTKPGAPVTDYPLPVQLSCPETAIDLALDLYTDEVYDMYSQRAVVYPTGTPLPRLIPGLKLWVRNAHDRIPYTARTRPSQYTAWAYIKEQRWYMYNWPATNTSRSMLPLVYSGALDYQIGDVTLHKGNRLLQNSGGEDMDQFRGTGSIMPGDSRPLNPEMLSLNSRSVCGNAVLIFRLDSHAGPLDKNVADNFRVLPLFVDCWVPFLPRIPSGSCEVYPNYFDEGQTTWITYSNSGINKVYEYRAAQRSITQLSYTANAAVLRDVVTLHRAVEIESDQLESLGLCLDRGSELAGSFMASLDVLLLGLKDGWSRVKPENGWQTNEHRKLNLVLEVLSDLLSFSLQPTHPFHNGLHIPLLITLETVRQQSNLGLDENGTVLLDNNSLSRQKRQIGMQPRHLLYDGDQIVWDWVTNWPYGDNRRISLNHTDEEEDERPDDSKIREENASASSSSSSNRDWHSTLAFHLFDLIKQDHFALPGLTPDRAKQISHFFKVVLWDKPEDQKEYSYLSPQLLRSLKQLVQMLLAKDGPRLFDDIPFPIYNAYRTWALRRLSPPASLPLTRQDLQDLVTSAKNATENLIHSGSSRWRAHRNQLKLLDEFWSLLLEDDHPTYLHDLYSRLFSALQLDKVWMIQDSVPIGEPAREDVCKRYAALRMWENRVPPVFQLSMATVTPFQYETVYWKSENGTVYRGDRSDLTGQVFWTKVAQCNCEDAQACGDVHEEDALPDHGHLGSTWTDIGSGTDHGVSWDQEFSDTGSHTPYYPTVAQPPPEFLSRLKEERVKPDVYYNPHRRL